MNGESTLRTRQAPSRAAQLDGPSSPTAPSRPSTLPLLIQVPHVMVETPRGVRQARRPSASAAQRLRGNAIPHARFRPRRRLRRGVRLAAYALGLAIPFTMAAWLLPGPTSGGTAEIADPGISGRYASVLSPLGATGVKDGRGPRPRAEVVSPVVFPGYLLPDDGSEETPHAGG